MSERVTPQSASGPSAPTPGGLPPYTIRRSRRARRVRLSVTARDGLVVSLPPRVPGRVAEEAVVSRREWAEKALAAIAPRREAMLAPAADRLPSSIELASTGRVIPVTYEVAASATSARERDGVLVVRGSALAEERLAALRRWHDRVARVILPDECLGVARSVPLPVPTRITVRGQRTRWGSCSARGTLSLNRNLVFLPPHLVRYVIAHELAHLVHLDHSPRFWALVDASCPGAADLRAQMREARCFVPVWADA